MNEKIAGRLTTHVLDVRSGQPARRLEFTLFRIVGDDRHQIGHGRTNDEGRTNQPLLEGAALTSGTYEIVFAAGAYQENQMEVSGSGFYDFIPIRFQISDPSSHYHVPLLLSPFGYSTYRGS